jgi:hypothetical protein
MRLLLRKSLPPRDVQIISAVALIYINSLMCFACLNFSWGRDRAFGQFFVNGEKNGNAN